MKMSYQCSCSNNICPNGCLTSFQVFKFVFQVALCLGYKIFFNHVTYKRRQKMTPKKVKLIRHRGHLVKVSREACLMMSSTTDDD